MVEQAPPKKGFGFLKPKTDRVVEGELKVGTGTITSA